MPLDSTDFVVETKPDLSKPSLEGLSWLLRHLPTDHAWDFTTVGGPRRNGCGSAGCAYGLMRRMWGEEYRSFEERLGISDECGDNFFFFGSYPVPDSEVTPLMVADHIDAYLAETHK